MDNTDTLLEVGLGFTADYNKVGGFIGKEEVLLQKEELILNKGLKQRLAQVLCLDPLPLMYHGEIIWKDGMIILFIYHNYIYFIHPSIVYLIFCRYKSW
jgi:4-methylaminobutanoate oxidase (formaldehyde-forming)